jgi:hypothetical protein
MMSRSRVSSLVVAALVAAGPVLGVASLAAGATYQTTP